MTDSTKADRSPLRFGCLCCALAFALPDPGFGQGSLTPPGAPAPTMKSLDQIEARTIVNAANTPGDASSTFIISAPGSYYLTGNVTGADGKHGITIRADDVTLDLNGFALVGGGGTASRGIHVPVTQRNLCIRNGTVRGWNGGGVRAESAIGTLSESLRLSDNTGAEGIFVGNGSLVRSCVASGNATGIRANDRCQVLECISTINTGSGFVVTDYVSLLDCTSSRNKGAGFAVGGTCELARCSATRNELKGFAVGSGSTISDCIAGNNVETGIAVVDGCTVRDCTAGWNSQSGISAASSCQIVGNTCQGNPTGVLITGHHNRIDGNFVHIETAAGIGFHVQGQNNVVVRNVARGPLRQLALGLFVVDTAYVADSFANNSFGPIHGSASGTIPSSLSPWANFQNF